MPPSTPTRSTPWGAATVGDVAVLLSVIAGPVGQPDALDDNPAPLATVHPADLRGLPVAWAPTLGDRVPVDAEVLAPLETAVGVSRRQGAHIDQLVPTSTARKNTFRTLRAVGFNTLWGDQLDATRKRQGRPGVKSAKAAPGPGAMSAGLSLS